MSGLKHELNTREKILNAAKREFLEKGFAGTNVRAIAEKAGVTTGALYNLFKNHHRVSPLICRAENLRWSHCCRIGSRWLA